MGEHSPLTEPFAAEIITPMAEELGARELPLIANIVFGALRGGTTRAVGAAFQAAIGVIWCNMGD